MRSCKFISFLVMFLFSTFCYANSVVVEVNPARPAVNQEFEVIFKVTSTTSKDEPSISFNPGIMQVRGRRLAGKSSSARYVNGKFSSSVDYTYIYNLISPRAGAFQLTQVKVVIGGQTINVPNKVISIGTKPMEPKDFFLRAEVNKTTAFLGEGLDLKYYLYSKVQNIGRTEIEIFPKLNNFIKRFYMPTGQRQAVRIDGVVYRRSLEYSARIYPEKLGKLKVDPLRLKFQYTNYRNNRNIGGFGFAFGRPQLKSLQSDPVEIQVIPVTGASIPQEFTGLIGEHDFKISVNKNKFLVNEAIEVRLEVTGPGALENYPAPVLYQDPNLEQFDTKSDLTEVDKSNGKKVFDFTYLARGPLSFKGKTLRFFYFDPDIKSFRAKEVQLPPLLVGGENVKAKSSGPSTSNNSEEDKSTQSQIDYKSSVIAPSFSNTDLSVSNSWIKYLNFLLLLGIAFLLVDLSRGKLRLKKVPDEVTELTREIEKNGFNYSRLSRYFRQISHFRNDLDNKMTLVEIVENLPVSDECKKYFNENIQIVENMEYNESSKNYDKKFVKKYFNEVNGKVIQQ